MTNAEYANGLVQLADWFMKHPEVKVPPNEIRVHVWEKEPLVAAARAMGKSDKDFGSLFVEVSRDFGPIKLVYQTYRDKVCTQRVVGTRHHEARLVGAYDEPIVEWDCPDSLLAPESVPADEPAV